MDRPRDPTRQPPRSGPADPARPHVAPLGGDRLRGLAEHIRDEPPDPRRDTVQVTGESGFRFKAMLLQLSSRGIALRVPFPYDRELLAGCAATVLVTLNGENHLVACTVLEEEPIADGAVVALGLSGAGLDGAELSESREHALSRTR